MSLSDCMFTDDGADISLIGVRQSGAGIAIFDVARHEIDDLTGRYDQDEIEDARLLIVISGVYHRDSLTERVDLQILRLLLEDSPWCRWVEAETLSDVSTTVADLAFVCGWLETAGATLRLRRSQLELAPRELPTLAPTVLALEDVVDDYQFSGEQAHALVRDGVESARSALGGGGDAAA